MRGGAGAGDDGGGGGQDCETTKPERKKNSQEIHNIPTGIQPPLPHLLKQSVSTIRPARCSARNDETSQFFMVLTCRPLPGSSAVVPPVMFVKVLSVRIASVHVLATYIIGVSTVPSPQSVVCRYPTGMPLVPGGATNSLSMLDWALKYTSLMYSRCTAR